MRPFGSLLNQLATCAVGAAGLTCTLAASAFSESELERLGGRIEASIGGATYVLPSLSTDIDADVQGDLVTVTVRQRFDNPFDRPMHATYLFPLNKDAAVFAMTMEVGGERIQAQIDRVDAAKKTFEAAKAQGKSAALLEQKRPNVFTQSIANLVPGVPVDVTLRYVHAVPKVDGEFELVLPLVVGPRFEPPPGAAPHEERPSPTLDARPQERYVVPEDDHLVHAGAAHAVAADPLGGAFARGARSAGALAGAAAFGAGGFEGGAFVRVAANAPRWRVADPASPRDPGNGPTGAGAHAQSTFIRAGLEELPPYPPVAGLDLPRTIAEDRVSVRVSLNAQVPLVSSFSPTHAVSTEERSANEWSVRLAEGRTIDNADFVLRYGLAGEQTQAGALSHRDERGGFFSLLVEPPAAPSTSQVTPRELVFVLDASGSMAGLPMEASKAFMREALAHLRTTDSFRIIRFSDAATEFSAEPLPATAHNIVRGIRYTNALAGSGGTMMTSGIRQALAVPAPPGSLRLVVFLTDGYIGNDAEVLELIGRHTGEARLFAFGVGSSVNRHLLSEMSRAGRGFTRYMDAAERVDEVARELAGRIQSPVLTDIEVDWGSLDVDGVHPRRLPDLFAGQSLRIQGRTPSRGIHEVTVRGRVNGREAALPVRIDMTHATADAVALTWARSAIADAMRDLAHARGDASKAKGIEQAVTRLGLDFSLVTRWTAFVAVSEKIYNESPKGTPTRAVPLAKVKGVRETAYGERASFAGHAAPEPPALIAMAVLATLSAAACRRRLRKNRRRHLFSPPRA